MNDRHESFEHAEKSFPTGAFFLSPDEVRELLALSDGKLRMIEPLVETENPFTIVGDAEEVPKVFDNKPRFDGQEEVVSEPIGHGLRHLSALSLEEIAEHARLVENK